MFTDRFIKIPIKMYDVDHKELTGQEILVDATMKINPFEISRYYSTTSENEREIVKIVFKDGDGLYCYMTLNDFEALLNKHTE